MSAPCITVSNNSSSDSDDEEEKERLREASFSGFPSVTTGSASKSNVKDKLSWKKENNRTKAESRPSLRNSQNSQADEFNTDLHVTAEVKAFIAKKLSQSLDQSIELLEESRQNGHQIEESLLNKSSEGDLGFKMFSQKTKKLLEDQKEAKRQKLQKARKKRQQRDSSSDSSEEEARLAEAAVSAEFVLQHSAMRPTTVTTETESYPKHAGKNKMADSDIDNKVTENDSKQTGGNHCEFDNENENSTVKKCKKKKKKNRFNELSDEKSESNISFSQAKDCAKKKKKKCKHSHSE